MPTDPNIWRAVNPKRTREFDHKAKANYRAQLDALV